MFKHFRQLKPQPNLSTEHTIIALNTSDEGYYRRYSFALFSEMKSQLADVGITADAFWCYMLHFRSHKFSESRKQFTTQDWAVVAARLLCLKGNEMSFTQFIEEIKQKGNCRVYRVNPDFSKKRLFDGVFDKSLFNRAKRYANATGVNIEINAYGHSEVVTPDIENSRMHEGSPPISDCQDC